MKTILFCVLALCVGQACARCPGSDGACNGKGDCTIQDVCECYANWQGVGCDDRVCPYAIAWSGFTEEYNRPYLECAGRGSCDRTTGQCQCDVGFEGKGCNRMSCPGNCNGHGTCNLAKLSHTQASLRHQGQLDFSNTDPFWDQSKIQLCNCDPGYEGHDCSQKICPRGDDPMTAGTTPQSWAFQIQGGTVKFEDMADDHEIAFTFTDYRGNRWTTRPILIQEMTEISVKELFESTPNHVVPELTVTSLNSGHELKLEFRKPIYKLGQLSLGCDIDGCQPRYVGSASGGIEISETVGDAEFEDETCSSRGICDQNTGLCVCESGYYGEACSKQTTVR